MVTLLCTGSLSCPGPDHASEIWASATRSQRLPSGPQLEFFSCDSTRLLAAGASNVFVSIAQSCNVNNTPLPTGEISSREVALQITLIFVGTSYLSE